MKIAKASKQDIEEVIKYFKDRENRNVRVPNGWRRVVFGYEVLVNNTADSTLDHLEFCPYLDGHVSNEQ